MRRTSIAIAALALTWMSASQISAQVNTGAPLPAVLATPPTEMVRSFDSAELDRIMSPIALYPDPLLAQVLTATTFAGDIPAAMRWVDARQGLSGEQLANALAAERVSWDPSVQALVAFPTVLQMMATSMPWTDEVGQAVKLQNGDVIDAVQRLRAQAKNYGYLRSSSEIEVVQTPAIEIRPVNPSYIVVPYYNPVVVFAPPRPRFVVSSGIYLGFGVHLGSWYEPFGWRSSGFYWPTRRVVVDYSGWNHRYGSRDYRDYRDVRYEPRYDTRNDGRTAVQRYTVSPPVATPRGYTDRGRTVQVDTRVDRDRSRDNSPRVEQRSDNRGSRDSQWEGRTTQPRVEQPRQAQVRSEPQSRSEPSRGAQASPSRGSQSAGVSRDGGYRRRQ
ncbi:MAG: DUF3300 domain-containing protein [Gemmatimonadota bacterium]